MGTVLCRIASDDFDVIETDMRIPDGRNGIRIDIRDFPMLKNIINITSPDVIVNLAAMTNVDGCEQNPLLAREINTAGVQHLCDAFDGKIVHLSTDYVFDGQDGPYSEESQVNPISVYGETKLASERILLYSNPSHLVIRGNVIYDDLKSTQASFLNWVVDSLEDRKEIYVVNDQINNPTWTVSIADIILLCIEKSVSGIVHWADADLLNRYDFALKIADKFELDSKLIKPITTDELEQDASRPLQSGLKTDYLNQLLGIIPPSIDDCLNAILERRSE